MGYTLLQLVDQACGEMGLAQPINVIGSTANQTLQLLALAQSVGKDLVEEFEWQRLVKAYVFATTAARTDTGTLVAGSPVITGLSIGADLAVGDVISGNVGLQPYVEVLSIQSSNQVTMNMPALTSGTGVSLTFAKQDYALPADFDRMVSDSNWDRTNHWRNMGTKSSQEWQWLQGGLISIGPRERYRIYDGKLRIFSALTASITIAFEYVSTNWVLKITDNSASEALFTADNDRYIWPDQLMVAGLKYYFLRAKKLDYGIEMTTFEQLKALAKTKDVPMPTQSLAPIQQPALISPWSAPEGSWPTVSTS